MNMVFTNTFKTAIAAIAMAVFSVACTEKPDNPGNDQGENVELVSIAFDPAEVELTVGDTYQLTLKAVPENASTEGVQFFTNNPAVVSLDGNTVTALAKGNATITAAAPNGLQCTLALTIVEKKEDEPENPNPEIPDTTAFNVEFLNVSATDFQVRIVPNVESVRYFVWCEEAAVIDQIGVDNDEGIIAHDMAILEQIRLKACEEEGQEVTMKQVLMSYTDKGIKDKTISAQVEGYLQIKPSTKYYVYVYGIELDGTVTTEVFTFDQTTPADIASDDNFDIIMAFSTGFIAPDITEPELVRICLRTEGTEELNFYITPSSQEDISGTYTTANADIEYASLYYTSPEQGTVYPYFEDVTAVISQSGDVFDIMVAGDMENGESAKLTYYGTLEDRR